MNVNKLRLSNGYFNIIPLALHPCLEKKLKLNMTLLRICQFLDTCELNNSMILLYCGQTILLQRRSKQTWHLVG